MFLKTPAEPLNLCIYEENRKFRSRDGPKNTKKTAKTRDFGLKTETGSLETACTASKSVSQRFPLRDSSHRNFCPQSAGFCGRSRRERDRENAVWRLNPPNAAHFLCRPFWRYPSRRELPDLKLGMAPLGIVRANWLEDFNDIP